VTKRRATWEEVRARLLEEDPEARAIYDELEQRMRLVRAVIVGRNARGLTQRQLAELSGLTQPAIARFERADTDPRLGTVMKILHALELQLVVDADGIANAKPAARRAAAASRSGTSAARVAARKDSDAAG